MNTLTWVDFFQRPVNVGIFVAWPISEMLDFFFILTCQRVQVGLITKAVRRCGIQGYTLSSHSSCQLLLTIWIMGIYDLTGSSYDTEKQFKSMWESITYDTSTNILPTAHIHLLSWHRRMYRPADTEEAFYLSYLLA